ncbi:MAG: response regulator [Nitrospiraceae bacterium]
MGTYTQANNISGKPSVLVVDDEAGPRDALKVILRPFFTIHSAENAKSALEVLKDQHIDLITLDQKLPDCQGIDLLQDIKHDHSDVEVIIITGYGSLKSAMEGIRRWCRGLPPQALQRDRADYPDQSDPRKETTVGLPAVLSPHVYGALGHGAGDRTGVKDIQSNYFGIGKSSGESKRPQAMRPP